MSVSITPGAPAARPREPLAAPSQAPASSPGPRWPVYASAAVIIGVIFLAYLNCYQGAMVLDDRSWILDNPSIKQLSSLGWIFAPANAGVVGGRPIVSLTLAVNYAIGGENPLGYHVVNVLIHMAAALVLFGVVRRTLLLPSLGRRFGAVATPLALAVAAIWGVHPLCTAAVTYIIQRTESLAALFYLATLYSMIRGATSEGSRARIGWYTGAFIACLLGMLTKETVFTAPVVILLYDRVFLAGTLSGAWKSRWGVYAALAATWFVGFAMLWLTDFHGHNVGLSVRAFTWQTYLETQPGVILHYLQTVFWPAGLSIDYNWPAATSVAEIAIPGTIVVGLLLISLVALAKGWPSGFLGTAFFMLLAPTSSIVPIRDAAFDHRMYLPLAVLVVLVVTGLYSLWQWLVARSAEGEAAESRLAWALPAAAAGAVVIALGFATSARNDVYQTEESLWKDAIAKNAKNWRGHASLGFAAAQAGRTSDAIEEFEAALAQNEDEPQVHLELADALAAEGRFEEAIYHYNRALKLEPTSALAHTKLAFAISRQFPNNPAKLDEAIAHYQEALKIDPKQTDAHTNLADLLMALGKLPEAVEQSKAALVLQPDSAAAHANLALALFGLGRHEEAVGHFEKALQLEPKLARLEGNLALSLIALKRFDEAVTYLERDLNRHPNDAVAHFGMGNLYEKTGKTDKAIAEYERALELDPKEAAAHLNLGAISMERGQSDEALAHFNAILKDDDVPMQLRVAGLYRQQKEYRKAIIHYRTALAADPENAEAKKEVGQCYVALGNKYRDDGSFDQAIEAYRQAVVYRPKDAAAHNSLAVLLEREGSKQSIDEAVEHFKSAAELNPDDAVPDYNLGMSYYGRHQWADAANAWRAAMRRAPGNTDYIRPLAWLLATCPDAAVRNGDEALKLAEKADDLTDHVNPEMLGTLAAAQAEKGQFPTAAATAERAYHLADNQGKDRLANELAARVKEYRSGKPHRETPKAGSPSTRRP